MRSGHYRKKADFMQGADLAGASVRQRQSERGNILFIILLAVVLLGLLTAVIQSTNRPESANIDDETLVIRATEAQRYASELERAVLFILQNGYSEVDLRFAHPDAHADYGTITDQPGRQIFNKDGGGASYRAPPEDINDGSAWEFYAGTDLPGIGSDKADLVAVLPYVTQAFCEKINALNQQPVSLTDSGLSVPAGMSPGGCVQIGAVGRFDDGRQYYDSPSTPNTMDEAGFAQDANISAARPAPEACVKCARDTNGSGGATDEYHFYHVLLAR